jgi:di/tricarboxylate transporter
VGTPPNLVASNTLREATGEGFELFEFAPYGVPALIIGSFMVAFVGRHFLPKEMPESMRESKAGAGPELKFAHELEERRFRLRVGLDSPFHEKPMRETGLGAALGLGVFRVRRGSENFDDVGGDFVLRSGDLLSVQGRLDEFRDFIRWRAFEVARGAEIGSHLLLQKRLVLTEAYVSENSDMIGLQLNETDFVRRFNAHALTVKHRGKIYRDPEMLSLRLEAGDRFQLEMERESVENLKTSGQFDRVEILTEESLGEIYPKSDQLLELKIPDESHLGSLTISHSGIGELGLRIIAIGREAGGVFFPAGEEGLEIGDSLLIHGSRADIDRFHGLQSLAPEEGLEDGDLETDSESGHAEITLSPRSELAGKTPLELDFHRRYGLQILSIWRSGRSYRSHVRNIRLEFGDALLVSGPRERIEALAGDEDFLILSQSAYQTASAAARSPRWKTALSGGLMLAVVISVLSGWLPIAIAAVAGATAMITTRCLSIQDAYRAIEWKSVFLIACMIPLGTAMQTSHAAEWLGKGVAWLASPFGAWGLIVGLYIMTTLATTIVPTTALVVIMASIGMDAAASFPGIDKSTVVMAIALAASASFTSPISHPANVLVMGPGGYRFIDYLKMGMLLAVVVMLTILPILAFWR